MGIHMLEAISLCINTKMSSRFSNLIAYLALKSVNCVCIESKLRFIEIDTKKYIKIEKIHGGSIEDCCVLNGVMCNKDVINTGRMRRKIMYPRIILIDYSLEYKNDFKSLGVEIHSEEDFINLLNIEEEWILKVCE